MKTYGAYEATLPDPVSHLALTFSRLDFVTSWRKCGRLADFLAQHIAEDLDTRELATNELSSLLNELIENTVKFSCPDGGAICIELPFWGDRLTIVTRHCCHPAQTERLATCVTTLSNGDPETLFIEQMLATATADPDTSGLGLITLRKDHDAKIGLAVEPTGDTTIVTLQAHVPLQRFLQYPEIPPAFPSRSPERTRS